MFNTTPLPIQERQEAEHFSSQTFDKIIAYQTARLTLLQNAENELGLHLCSLAIRRAQEYQFPLPTTVEEYMAYWLFLVEQFLLGFQTNGEGAEEEKGSTGPFNYEWAAQILLIVARLRELEISPELTLLQRLRARGGKSKRVGAQTSLQGSQLGLTWREAEILCLMRTGLRNREIAQKLHLRESTIHQHISNIYRKLGVRNRVEAINQQVSLPSEEGAGLMGSIALGGGNQNGK